MKNVKIEPFHVIGIAVRTTNHGQQAAKDIPALWRKFMSEEVYSKIPNKVDDTVYAFYTDYESDHNHPYTTIIGHKVKNLDNVPSNLVSKSFEGGDYVKFTIKGNIKKDLIINKWFEIWNTNLDRSYTVDFEVYDDRSKNMENAEVDILIAIN